MTRKQGRDASQSWTPPPQSDAGARPRLVCLTRAASLVPALSSVYDLIEARHERAACALLRARAQEFAGALIDVDLVGAELDGVRLSRILRGQVPDAELPAYARQLPTFNAPVLLLAEDPSRVSADVGQVITRPVTLPAVTVAINDWILSNRR